MFVHLVGGTGIFPGRDISTLLAMNSHTPRDTVNEGDVLPNA